MTNDMTDWNTKVCAPAMELAAQTMPALSIRWGRSVVVYTGCAIIGVVSFAALALSPELLSAVNHPWFPTAVRLGCAWAVAICTAFPVFVASGPAHVSTQCDVLMEALNELRVSCQSLSLALDLHRHLCVDRSPRHVNVSLRELILERNAT